MSKSYDAMKLKQKDLRLALFLTIPAFLVIFIASYCRWFRPGFSAYGDWMYIPDARLAEYSFTSFSSAIGMPNYDTIFTANLQPLSVLQKLLWRTFSIDFGVIEKIMYFLPFVVLVFFSMYFLTRKLFSNPITSLYSSIFYSLNTYIFVIMSEAGHINTGMSYAFAPITLGFFILLFRECRWSTAILAGLTLSVEIIFDIRISYILIFLIFFAFLFFFPFKRNANSETKHSRLAKFFQILLPFLIVAIIHSYWISWVIPVQIMKSGSSILPAGYNNPYWVTTLSFQNIINALTTYHPFWNEKIRYFTRQPINPVFYIFPLLFYFPLLAKTKDRNILYFSLISILSAFFLKGSSSPLGSIYIWLFNHFPGFNMLREPQKFFVPLMMADSVLFGVSVTIIHQNICNLKLKGRALLGSFFLLMTILIVFYSVSPAILQKIQGTFHMTKLPDHDKLLFEFLDDDKEFSRILWVPYKQKFSYFSERHPAAFPDSLNKDVFGWIEQDENDMTNFLKQPYSKDLLSMVSVKYIIVPEDIDQTLFKEFGKTKENLVKVVDNIDGLKRLNISTEIYIWENSEYLPRIFTTNKIQTYNRYSEFLRATKSKTVQIQEPFIISDDPNTDAQPYEEYLKSPHIESHQINPGKFSVRVSDCEAPYYLIFLEPFDPLWKVYLSPKEEMWSLSGKNYLQEANHFKIYEYANAWRINKTGTYDLIIEYYPQRFIRTGLLISSSGTLLFILLFVFFRLKEKRKLKDKNLK
jgi:hypothetical protein